MSNNLLEDTVAALARHGHGPEHVAYVGIVDDKHHVIQRWHWQQFAKVADVDYNPNFEGDPSPALATNLVVVGKYKEWWLSREWLSDYASTHWRYHHAPVSSLDDLNWQYEAMSPAHIFTLPEHEEKH